MYVVCKNKYMILKPSYSKITHTKKTIFFSENSDQHELELVYVKKCIVQ